VKVDSTSNARIGATQAGAARAQQGGSAAATGGASSAGAPAADSSQSAGDASVNLSSLSSHLRTLAASGSADIDTAHVESIKDAIRNGTLQIDTGKIADGVLDTARSLLKPPSGA
jgi:negative regulator of flagellin synthesis FlgM